MPRYFAMGLVGLVLFIGACGGDSSPSADALSLSDYFNRLQALSDEAASRAADGTAEPASPDLTDAASFDDLADGYDASLDIFRDFRDDVRDLNPPSAAQSGHNALVNALDDFIDGNEEVANQLADVSTEAELTAIFEDAAAAIDQDRVGRACENLQQVAADNNVSVDLDCGDDGE